MPQRPRTEGGVVTGLLARGATPAQAAVWAPTFTVAPATALLPVSGSSAASPASCPLKSLGCSPNSKPDPRSSIR